MALKLSFVLGLSVGCAHGAHDTPREAKVRQDCLGRLIDGTDEWKENYCETEVSNWRKEWRRQDADEASRGAQQSPPKTVTNEPATEIETEDQIDARLRLMKRERETEARRVLAECQTNVDAGAFAEAAGCWTDNLAELNASNFGGPEVPDCLSNARAGLDGLRRCASTAENTDDEVIAKKDCLDAHAADTDECGALSLKKIRAEVEAKVDFAATKTRVESKAAPIVARRQKAAADEAARQAKAEEAADQQKKRCIGTNAIQVVLALRLGRDVSAADLKGCTYRVAGATVENTTRDGWMIVRWGESTVAAIKSRKRHTDGSYLRTSATASYVGLGTFDRIDGGSATIATFKLAE
jgi:hypothetical protein